LEGVLCVEKLLVFTNFTKIDTNSSNQYNYIHLIARSQLLSVYKMWESLLFQRGTDSIKIDF